MALLLGLLLFSFVVTSIALIPYIDLLYKMKFQRRNQTTLDAFGKHTPIFDKFHKHKVGTPVGGGLLVIVVVSFMFMILFPILRSLGLEITSIHNLTEEVNILFFTFISFGILGLYDDIMKFFNVETTKFFGLRMRHKLIIQIVLATIIATMLYVNLEIDILNIPRFGFIRLGWLYIPFAAFMIVMFTNAINITDGLDGLAGGLLMISLFALWYLSASILDTPLSMFLALWLGSLIAYLYFNTYPARIWMGDVGSLAFGAAFAVVGLLLGKVMSLTIIGGIFIAELLSSAIQLTSKKYFNTKVFTAAPLHLMLQKYGWEEPKIVMRAWLAGIILALFGLWLAII